MSTEGYGSLAAALAKAQAAFPVISRDKEVTVQTKSGGSYKFKYAPLDTILAAVRAPLAANGLAIVQLLDEDTLVTSLLHESGAILSGRTPIPATEGVQAYGSAITYLRRYSIQALLGIAAEEDDDGNTAAGNRATFGARSEAARADAANVAAMKERAASPETFEAGDWAIAGIATAGKPPYDGEARMQPDESYVFGFRLAGDDKKSYAIAAEGPMALPVSLAWEGLVGARVHVSGPTTLEPWFKDGKRMPAYRVIHAQRIEGPEVIIPANPETLTTDDLQTDTEAELDAIAGSLGLVPEEAR